MLILEYRGSSSYMSLYSNQDIITVISWTLYKQIPVCQLALWERRKPFLKGLFSIYTDIRKLQDKAKTSYQSWYVKSMSGSLDSGSLIRANTIFYLCQNLYETIKNSSLENSGRQLKCYCQNKLANLFLGCIASKLLLPAPTVADVVYFSGRDTESILPPSTSALLHNISTLGISVRSMTNLLK